MSRSSQLFARVALGSCFSVLLLDKRRLDPASFHVRSASAVLPPGADWVEGAMERIVTRPGQSLTPER